MAADIIKFTFLEQVDEGLANQLVALLADGAQNLWAQRPHIHFPSPLPLALWLSHYDHRACLAPLRPAALRATPSHSLEKTNQEEPLGNKIIK